MKLSFKANESFCLPDEDFDQCDIRYMKEGIYHDVFTMWTTTFYFYQ